MQAQQQFCKTPNVLSNCFIVGNTDIGATNCVLESCVVSENHGRGIGGGMADGCIIFSNAVTTINTYGGGAAAAILKDCVLYANTAQHGGGAYNCVLNSCTLSNNVATDSGGAIFISGGWTNAPQQNNTLIANSANNVGGGVYALGSETLELTKWVFMGNSAANDGGGMYVNLAGHQAVLTGCTFSGNRSGGNGGGLSGAKSFPVLCSGCEFTGNKAGAAGGAAYNAVLANSWVAGNSASNGGGVYGSANGCVFSNNFAYADGGGVEASISPSVGCRFLDNTAANGGALYSYLVPGSSSNCVFTGNSAKTNGGAVFADVGVMMVGCYFSRNEAAFGGAGFEGTYSNCDFAWNYATDSGGALYSVPLPYMFVYNCSLSNNSATNEGGGAFNARLFDCLLVGNSAESGGGAYGGAVHFCTVANNLAADTGGGLLEESGGTVYDSIICYNDAPNGSNYSGNAAYDHCCTTPLPQSGIGSFTNSPGFLAMDEGNFRLRQNSSCVNAAESPPQTVTDLDGRPRVVGGVADVGAYEFQGASIGEFIGWLQKFGLPTDGSADYTDTDGDRMNNWGEWRSGTDPTNALSVLEMLPPAKNASGVNVKWQSVSGTNYFLERASSLSADSPFTLIQSNIVGQASVTSYVDTNAMGGPVFYRVGVQ